MYRRNLVLGGASASFAALFGARFAAQAADAPPASGPTAFDASTVRNLARELAKHPFQDPDTKLPGPLDSINYDTYRGIRFKTDRSLWHGQNLPFQVEFFHRGFLYRSAVDIYEVAGGQATKVPYSADLFDYADPKLNVPDNLGFAGFRVHAPINRPDYFDEICVFLGASYFRAVAKGQVYGLSARGLAIGTGDPRGEEFARFRAFWIERPQPGVNSLVIHALLDSQSVAGAYRFTIRAGEETVFDVETALYPRVDITEPGIAPLTAMFFFDANDRRNIDDWRPAAHDSGGLAMLNGHGEDIWRPLNNPTDLQISAFTDINPRNFGLMQRKRSFFDYQDLEVQYEKRPSLWIEPIGDWGQGVVELVEIPTTNEMNDNIVAFWRPKDKLNAKGEYDFTYRMHWGWDGPKAPLARFGDTRIGATGDRKGREFVLDLTGDSLKDLPPDSKPHADIGANTGKIQNVVVQPNPDIHGWRISFDLMPEDAKAVELHCVLMNDKTPLSETWMYRWTP